MPSGLGDLINRPKDSLLRPEDKIGTLDNKS